MAEIILYVSLFAFGWASCLLFYFGKSVNFYYNMIKISQLLSLFIIVRALEHFSYAKDFRIKTMIAGDDTDHNIYSAKLQFEDEVSFFKDSFLKQIRKTIPNVNRDNNIFSDWDTAMKYLSNNTEFILKFIKENHD